MVETITGGQYEVEYSHPLVAAVAVRIEAKGYKPATSEPFKMEAGDVTFDARLEPGVGPSGVVHGPDGRPLAGRNSDPLNEIVASPALQRQVSRGGLPAGCSPGPTAGSASRPRPSRFACSSIMQTASPRRTRKRSPAHRRF